MTGTLLSMNVSTPTPGDAGKYDAPDARLGPHPG